MKTVIEMAREAGWKYADGDGGYEPLERFAALVREDERERCAAICQDHFSSDGHWIAQVIKGK